LSGGFGDAGELKDEGCAAVAVGCADGAKPKGASETLGDFAGDPEAEAGAYVFLCGEERLEDAVGVFGSYAGAVVFDGYFEAEAGREIDATRSNADAAGGIYGVDGVGYEVGDDLFELVGDGSERTC
jgi:hypothetical protein